ncbi:MarR family transcriptional regulator [Amycolatopsis sp. NPDC006125]|uniref:MarR family winged helix-turn-helix transcriptional regulator n=1 Tax=Amycolatopsis sp. NPDC006125 TaxID=3156730 RepID=UPI0033BCC5BE
MSEPERESTLELMRWVVWGQRRIAEDWIRERGLTHEQSAVLAYLTKNPDAIQRDVARAMRTSAPGVSRLLAGLERRGLVERQAQEDDARSRRVRVTPAGSELIQGFEEAMDRVEESILAPLGAEGRARLHDLLAQLASRIDPPFTHQQQGTHA